MDGNRFSNFEIFEANRIGAILNQRIVRDDDRVLFEVVLGIGSLLRCALSIQAWEFDSNRAWKTQTKSLHQAGPLSRLCHVGNAGVRATYLQGPVLDVYLQNSARRGD